MDLEGSLQEEAKNLASTARLFKSRFDELDTWLDGYIGSINERIQRRVSEMFKPLRGEVSCFIDENIERENVNALWKRRVEDEGIDRKIEELYKELSDEVRSRLEEFSRQLTVEFEMLGRFDMEGSEQYNPGNAKRTRQRTASKSTIVSALTGKKDISIDADVCTDTVTGYDWEGVQLLDTPGVHAGYTDYDETTYQTIDKADLLVFVITGELFDDLMGEQFRDLAFIRDKAAEILLVVNKMGMDPGTP